MANFLNDAQRFGNLKSVFTATVFLQFYFNNLPGYKKKMVRDIYNKDVIKNQCFDDSASE